MQRALFFLRAGCGRLEVRKGLGFKGAHLSGVKSGAVVHTRDGPFTLLRAQDPKVTEDRAFNKFGTNFINSPEPLYGAQFLPRKFKVAVTVAGDNSVDMFTNDIGVVVITDPDTNELQGYNIVVGVCFGEKAGGPRVSRCRYLTAADMPGWRIPPAAPKFYACLDACLSL